ncbi:general secretion pathway protein GspE [Corallococcus sp. H22C18031201]|uniref:GspE/PulE/PilB domain-containing protein n=1 Tax=Citreicoccus inhibens TaxID=2849499 RepID=UPI000E756006|nr:general secretion pathway protein GspE [Citreicoccus inhibens]MBU8897834.1 general secretion pathway protein GspE [Citreicoccus inhibens]RJS24900.1 general secretion pathway protein GspE [Corallococcus sp. H22C18031201]
MRLGEQLVNEGLVTAAALEEALESQVVHGGRLGTNLVELGLVSEQDLARSLGKLHNCAHASGEMVPDPKAIALVDAHHADDKEYLPMRVDATRLSLAVVNPHDFTTLDAIAFKTGKRVVPVVIPEFRMNQLLRRYCKAFRPLRAIDVDAARPRKPVGEAGAVEKVQERPPDLMSEEEFQAVYAQALRGGGEQDAEGLDSEEVITGVVLEELAPAPVAAQRPGVLPVAVGPAGGAGAPPGSHAGAVVQGTQAPAGAVPRGAAVPPPGMLQPLPGGAPQAQGGRPQAPGQAGAPIAARPQGAVLPGSLVPQGGGGVPPGAVASQGGAPNVAAPPPRGGVPPIPVGGAPKVNVPPGSLPTPPQHAVGPGTLTPQVPAAGPVAGAPPPAPGRVAGAPASARGGVPTAAPPPPGGAAPVAPPPSEAAARSPVPQAPARAPEPPPSPLTFAEAQAELGRSSDREDVARTVLRFAAGKWRRCLLLSVQGSLVTGWHGMGQGVRDAAVRRIGVALRDQSTFRLVRDTRSHYVGPVKRDAAMGVFYKLVGGGFPTTAVILPLLVRGKVVHLLYVDNGPDQLTTPDVGELLILSQSVGRSYEAMMRRRKGS